MDCILDLKIPGEISTIQYGYQLSYKIHKIFIDENTYLKFPTSLYMARKLFGIGDQIIKYATCQHVANCTQ